eukprot:TRINITY_DN1921_c0_g1_i1.p1 TRINITY_DN1921_c0_g1~~TRINITY_DN1921_c0_g1_i1.p1  ORF type:complete len:295 (-),score=117.49 TRINITY_DN1921_c0_g1_i1:272-1156(-)
MFTCGQLVFEKRDLITIEKTATAEQALAKLDEHNILSLPVTEDTQIVGIVSIYDLMALVAFGSCNAEGQCRFGALGTEISSLVGLHAEGKAIWAYDCKEPVSALLEPMSKGVHRVIVTQKSGLVCEPARRMVTQTDVVRFMFQHKAEWNEARNVDASRTIEELRVWVPGATVRTVDEGMSALAAFRNMEQCDHTCLPVVNAAGEVITQLSASDLRGLKESELPLLRNPVCEFMQARRSGRLTHPVTCTPRSSLEDVMLSMVVARIHQVWVVDEARKPIGVVSATDVIKCFFLSM